mmetsp:Transcript_35554/g.86019  ORF Transcript_35554/g.86019 Transcript_35554/m.86019 type:complete len:214 (+) Transcript_35554:570-1211(+)
MVEEFTVWINQVQKFVSINLLARCEDDDFVLALDLLQEFHQVRSQPDVDLVRHTVKNDGEDQVSIVDRFDRTMDQRLVEVQNERDGRRFNILRWKSNFRTGMSNKLVGRQRLDKCVRVEFVFIFLVFTGSLRRMVIFDEDIIGRIVRFRLFLLFLLEFSDIFFSIEVLLLLFTQSLLGCGSGVVGLASLTILLIVRICLEQVEDRGEDALVPG